MAEGIDIYTGFQTVTNWSAVRNAGCEYCYTKLTDGTRIAPNGEGGPYVRGARSVGIAPGGYHYAQPGDPVAQANVFADEVIRLGCFGPGNLPPALDIEESGIASKAAFAAAFLRQLQARIGGRAVAVYASASWMVGLDPASYGIPGLLIWVAAYGRNDGGRYPAAITSAGYWGPWDIHQYTSVGSISGISSGGLDRDFTPKTTAAITNGTSGGGFLMALTDAQQAEMYQWFQDFPSWKANREFDRVLSMSQGVDGQNFNGDQFNREQAYRDANAAAVADLQGQVAGLTTALGQLAQGQTVDLAAIQAAAQQGTADALTALPVQVTVGLSGAPAPITTQAVRLDRPEGVTAAHDAATQTTDEAVALADGNGR